MAHIFISYSKKNKDYAQLLKSELRRRGFGVWIDDVIEPSEDWWRNIRQAIKTASAVIIIMTPEAETSHYVGLELLHALEYKKPIFPLLRAGDVNLLNSDTWSRIANIQYTDVREGQLPPDSFYTKLKSLQNLIEQATQPNDGWTPQVEETGTPQPVSPQTQAELNAFVKRTRQFEYELVPPTPSHPQMWGVENILPQPFEWVYIPAGNVTINNQTYSVEAFHIAKYPITNAQFEVFIQADDGYMELKWWGFSAEALEWRRENRKPKSRAVPENNDPRANVSWYEAMAFCNWLTMRFNAHAPELPPSQISLQTEQQWQRAAQGDDNRKYPWGNDFDPSCCNCKENGLGRSTPVTMYTKGASPYGVMDMVGNVWEWCKGKNNRIERDFKRTRGGSWFNSPPNLRDEDRDLGMLSPNAQTSTTGFRIVMMNS